MSLLDKTQEIINKIKEKTQYINNCWVYTGSNNGHGYGQIRINGDLFLVHKLSAYLHGITTKYSARDQLSLHKNECEFKNCWNPEHLYSGTQKENIQDSIDNNSFNGPMQSAIKRVMKTTCKRGHIFTAANTYVTPQGKRRCRACRDLRGN